MVSVTIREIAAETGVSITAVSQILNGKGERFSSVTKEKVLQVAKERAYKPNFFAKNMITQHTNTIGMIVPEVTDIFFSQMVRGAEDYLNQNDYMIMLCNTANDKERENQYIEELLHRAVDGLIIASPNILAKNFFERMETAKKPFILLDRKRNDRSEGQITVDDYAGGYMATEHLVKLGHKKIGIITADASFYNVVERYQGYLDCMHDYHLNVEKDWVVSGNQTMTGGYQAAEKLLSTSVTAIFATNDLMAIGTYRKAFEEHYRIPEDLSVVGFDDIELSSFIVPPLTTVRQPIYDLGAKAAAFLIDKIAAPQEKMRNEELELSLIIRASTKRL